MDNNIFVDDYGTFLGDDEFGNGLYLVSILKDGFDGLVAFLVNGNEVKTTSDWQSEQPQSIEDIGKFEWVDYAILD